MYPLQQYNNNSNFWTLFTHIQYIHTYGNLTQGESKQGCLFIVSSFDEDGKVCCTGKVTIKNLSYIEQPGRQIPVVGRQADSKKLPFPRSHEMGLGNGVNNSVSSVVCVCVYVYVYVSLCVEKTAEPDCREFENWVIGKSTM